MPVSYPSTLPLALFEKTREQPAAFQVAQPRRGYGYVEPTGTDVPVFWSVRWRLTAAQAQEFRNWFRYTLSRGTLPFSMRIRTERGLVEHELQFLPESLLTTRQIGGDLWEYSATVMARDLEGEPEVDPSFDDVLLLLHGNGANNGSVFTDSSRHARTVTRINSSTFTSTTQSKFNGSSIRSSGTGTGFLTITLAEASGANWCVESFVRRDAAFDHFGLFSFASGNVVVRIDGAGQGGTYKLAMLLSGVEVMLSPSALPSEAWAYWRVSCEDNDGTRTLRMFIEGEIVDSYESTDSNLVMSSTTALQIGRESLAAFYGLNGYLAEYRLTNATRETAGHAVPVNPHPDQGL